MGGECIKYIIKKSEQFYFIYMKDFKAPKQPTTFLCKGKDLEKLLQSDKIHDESRGELKEKCAQLKPGQEASVMYEHYSGFN